MGAVEDLRLIGAPVGDPVATARWIGGLIMTRRQKAALLREYLTELGLSLTTQVREAAEQYAEAL